MFTIPSKSFLYLFVSSSNPVSSSSSIPGRHRLWWYFMWIKTNPSLPLFSIFESISGLFSSFCKKCVSDLLILRCMEADGPNLPLELKINCNGWWFQMEDRKAIKKRERERQETKGTKEEEVWFGSCGIQTNGNLRFRDGEIFERLLQTKESKSNCILSFVWVLSLSSVNQIIHCWFQLLPSSAMICFNGHGWQVFVHRRNVRSYEDQHSFERT